MQKITNCLWFNNQAEEAANFYTSLFKNSKIGAVTRYGESSASASGQPKGTVMTVQFQIDGQEFLALNGGTHFQFTPAFSLIVNCETQQEVDELWEKLSAGGDIQQCGWLTDKFGVTWQITPSIVNQMIQDKDPRKSENVMSAIIQMKKIDIATLQQAYNRE